MLAATLLLCFIALSMAAGPYDTFYEDKGRADPTASHPITFFVKDKQDFVDSCPQMLEAIATPESAQWNKQLSYGEMRQFVDEQSFERVHRFAVRHFGEERVIVSDNHDMVLVPTATVAEVETAFNCELHEFAHTEDAAFVARRPLHRPKLSHHIERSVDAISGLNHLPPHRAGQKPLFSTISSDDEEARKRQMGGTVSPQLLWRYYGVSNRTMASAAAKNSIFAALGQSFAPSDLAAWQQQFMLPTTRIQQVIGPNTPTSCASNPNNCIEASLDVQQITSTAQLGDTTFHSIDQSVQDIFLAWIQAVQSEASPPLVNSISYGSIATEDPKYDMEQFNHAACKAGLRGITVVVASGDDGVANFQARGNPNACQGAFQPSYPATSPFVLAVGATQGPEQQQPEVVCSSATGGGITSGGGFSDLFKTPDYQKRTVQAYLAAQQAAGTLPPTSKFNRYGRGYPDVAAMGHNYQIEVGGNLYEGSGTSASAPVTAALVSLINGGRLAAGKKSIGFLNPILYNTMAQNHTHFFHQITSGNNKCTASSVCCQDGFYADPNGGWNAATGNGSPKFQAWWALLVEQLP